MCLGDCQPALRRFETGGVRLCPIIDRYPEAAGMSARDVLQRLERAEKHELGKSARPVPITPATENLSGMLVFKDLPP